LGLILGADGRKMSKRWGNVVNPDDMINLYGADTLRLYEMFMGPFDQEIAWSTNSMIGARRFVEKVWRLQNKLSLKSSQDFALELNQSVKKVGEDIAGFSFNTAVSTLMILVNTLDKAEKIGRADYAILIRLLAPFAPHISEELWSSLGLGRGSVHTAPWPTYDETKLTAETVTIVVQINGKVRHSLILPIGLSEDESVALAQKEEKVAGYLVSQKIKKIIFIPNRLINFVVESLHLDIDGI
jgi:leucyl-tRNA synthetase